ncbi:MAG: hypothetical protein M8357_03305 [Desulfobulbaceae bacterium]|nr:hypothetical protein [Desulfobulbaceae bacterium]
MTSASVKQRPGQDEELQAVLKTIQAFTAAFKSYSLYPEDHVFSRTNLEKFANQLAAFLASYGELSLGIEKNSLIYEGEKIFAGPPEENNPAYLLTRDGVIRLDFFQGIDTVEIAQLFRILNRHRSAGDESGGDIVTSLWQADFQHLEYEEVDLFALEGFNFDLASLKAAPDESAAAAVDRPDAPGPDNSRTKTVNTIAETTGTEATAAQDQSPARSETVTNLLRMEQALKILAITPEEEAILRSYVEEEERTDYTNDIIEILLIILISQKNKLHFTQVLKFLEAVFFDTLNKGNFHLAYKLCSNVLTIRNRIKAIRPWTLDLVDSFITSLSLPEHWTELSWVNNPLLVTTLFKEHQKFLWHVVRMLTPDIIFTLGPLMGSIGTDNIDVRNELYELIAGKARKDPDAFNTLLAQSDENINLLLFPVVEDLGSMAGEKISLQMTRHASVEVRRAGLSGYLTHASTPDFAALYHLLNDEDDVIVGRLLTILLSRAQPEEAEALLLRYLEQAVTEGIEHAHMFEYYKALSQCGSFRSVKLLQQILMESKLTQMFSNINSVHKKGSAIALKILGTEEALAVLQKGVRSLRPDIRMACQFALEKVK